MRDGLRIERKRTSWSFDCYDAAANVDLDALWNDQLLLREDVLHLEQWLCLFDLQMRRGESFNKVW